MSVDPETRAFYDREAAGYADYAAREAGAVTQWLEAVAAAMPEGGHLFDLGCGPGWGGGWFSARGYRVSALDASPGLAAEARARFGLDVAVGGFETLEAEAEYDAVWASFSLLHAPRAEMAAHLARIHRALKPGGTLYLGLKEGTGEERDHLGRAYTYYTLDEISARLTEAGFAIGDSARDTGTGFDGTPSRGLHVLARKHA